MANLSFNERIQRLSSQDLMEIEEVFSIFDKDGDGKIDVKDVGSCLRALDQNPTQADVDKCCESLDKTGKISFDVFLPILKDVARNRGKHGIDDFMEGLRHFDNDMDGTINGGELRRLLTGLGEKMADEEVEELLVGMEDEQGNVDYEQLIRMVVSGGTPNAANSSRVLLETSLDE